eukprot:788728-Prorocentrum_minimum.AAC.1
MGGARTTADAISAEATRQEENWGDIGGELGRYRGRIGAIKGENWGDMGVLRSEGRIPFGREGIFPGARRNIPAKLRDLGVGLGGAMSAILATSGSKLRRSGMRRCRRGSEGGQKGQKAPTDRTGCVCVTPLPSLPTAERVHARDAQA